MNNISLIPFRYRHEFKCDELWLEIKFVLDQFAQPLTSLFNVGSTVYIMCSNFVSFCIY